MAELPKIVPEEIDEPLGVQTEIVEAEARLVEEFEATWVTPPFQPIRAVLALFFIAGGFGLYEYVLLSFWSSPTMGIH